MFSIRQLVVIKKGLISLSYSNERQRGKTKDLETLRALDTLDIEILTLQQTVNKQVNNLMDISAGKADDLELNEAELLKAGIRQIISDYDNPRHNSIMEPLKDLLA